MHAPQCSQGSCTCQLIEYSHCYSTVYINPFWWPTSNSAYCIKALHLTILLEHIIKWTLLASLYIKYFLHDIITSWLAPIRLTALSYNTQINAHTMLIHIIIINERIVITYVLASTYTHIHVCMHARTWEQVRLVLWYSYPVKLGYLHTIQSTLV